MDHHRLMVLVVSVYEKCSAVIYYEIRITSFKEACEDMGCSKRK